MELINQEKLALISKEDINTLVEFDNKGLLLGPDESLEEYVKRLATLSGNIKELQQELKKNGKVTLIGKCFTDADMIPNQVFKSVQNITRTLYGFDIDWVPGFFTNYRMGILFAGCAMYSYDDFFALFIIRKAFKEKEKWIIYSRTELMAHELCHVAHIGFHTRDYEEIFAYQTSDSIFRRAVGGILRTTTDTYLLLGCVAVLLISQIINVTTRPPSEWHNFPIPLIYGISFSGFGLVFFRYLFFWRRFTKARQNLGRVFGCSQALPVLFRCKGNEIKDISRLNKEVKLRIWLSSKLSESVRWRVIFKKFKP